MVKRVVRRALSAVWWLVSALSRVRAPFEEGDTALQAADQTAGSSSSARTGLHGGLHPDGWWAEHDTAKREDNLDFSRARLPCSGLDP